MTLSQLIAKLIDLELDQGDWKVLIAVEADGILHETDEINVESYRVPPGLDVVKIGAN